VRIDVHSGLTLDVSGAIASDGATARLDVRFTRSELGRPIPHVSTPHGPLETPELGLLRFDTSVAVPLGRTAVLGTGSRDGRTTMLLLTPTVERAQ
jgi:hypothetical protein